MMLSNRSRKSSRLRALAMVPVVATALLVVNQPSVAGTLSAISSSELSLPDNDKGNEKTVIKNTIKISGNSAELKADGLNGTPTKFFLDGKEITEEQLKNIDKSKIASMNINKSDGNTAIYISTKDATDVKKFMLKDKPEDVEEQVVVIKGIEDVDYYVNGEKISADKLKQLAPVDKIKHVKVNKAGANGKATMEITIGK